jgi:endogenous inhibitor of DNA gyrase (YacG/DUF329 family)
MIKQVISPVNDINQKIERKLCPGCQGEFETNVSARVYCSSRCQRWSKNKRYKERSGMTGTATIFERERRSDCDYVESPTLAILEATAREKERLAKRPVIFYGQVPEFQPPAGIEWAKQEDGSWLMLA